MLRSLDIFKIDPDGGVLWRGAVKSFAVAQARIQILGLSSPGEYIILDEDTGQRMLCIAGHISAQVAAESVSIR
jgi:hypothetical protein